MRATWAEIDLSAIAHNVGVLAQLVRPAALCAVVKADGYGHGADEVAKAAIAAGAQSLAVALVEEGSALRQAGIEAPILLLSEPSVSAADEVVASGLQPAVYSVGAIVALANAFRAVGSIGRLQVHLKIDTGMHRVGAQPEDAVFLAKAISDRPELELASVWTHCAVADDPTNAFTAEQLHKLAESAAAIRAAGIAVPAVHAANSAVGLAHPGGRLDLVRAGIAVYGLYPGSEMTDIGLRPVMGLKSEVTWVKGVSAGEALSYGQRYRLTEPSIIATVCIGYADGLPRALGQTGGEVLIGGRRRLIAGNVTMDQLLVDCGADDSVAVGDEVVLLGRQGEEEISAAEWAELAGTISYEIVCGISPRVPRRYLEG